MDLDARTVSTDSTRFGSTDLCNEAPTPKAAAASARASVLGQGVRAVTGRWSGSQPSAAHPVTGRVKARIDSQLGLLASELGKRPGDAPFDLVAIRAAEYLAGIARRANARQICLEETLRCSPDAPHPPSRDRALRLGVFPVSANPLHWGHLLSALRAMSEVGLDKVVFVVQGIDRRKALASAETQQHRHALASKTVALLHPLGVYSSVGLDRSAIGEESIFRLLRLNAERRINAHYLVGSDHYRYVDSAGRPDTLPLLERNRLDPRMGFDPSRHSLTVVFLLRGRRPPALKSPLRVQFLPETIHASSSEVRRGALALAPFEAFDYLRAHADYASEIGLAAPRGSASGLGLTGDLS
jgi:hypothetical protein